MNERRCSTCGRYQGPSGVPGKSHCRGYEISDGFVTERSCIRPKRTEKTAPCPAWTEIRKKPVVPVREASDEGSLDAVEQYWRRQEA